MIFLCLSHLIWLGVTFLGLSNQMSSREIDSNQLMTQAVIRKVESIQLSTQVAFQGLDSESAHDSCGSQGTDSDQLITRVQRTHVHGARLEGTNSGPVRQTP